MHITPAWNVEGFYLFVIVILLKERDMIFFQANVDFLPHGRSCVASVVAAYTNPLNFHNIAMKSASKTYLNLQITIPV